MQASQMPRITCKDVLPLIERQKDIALQMPVYVFCTNAAKDSIKSITDQFCQVYQNDSVVSINEPSKAETVLANAVPRTLVFIFFKGDRLYQKEWIDRELSVALQEYLPTVDTYGIDVTFAEKEPAAKLGANRLPCALVYRMGHLVSKIFPELEEGIVRDQVENYKFEIAKKVQESEFTIKDYSKEGLRTDEDRIQFEQRMREREAEEKKKEEEAKRKHQLEVRRKIQEYKLDRQRKYGQQ